MVSRRSTLRWFFAMFLSTDVRGFRSFLLSISSLDDETKKKGSEHDCFLHCFLVVFAEDSTNVAALSGDNKNTREALS